jgi:hypothetical protein
VSGAQALFETDQSCAANGHYLGLKTAACLKA